MKRKTSTIPTRIMSYGAFAAVENGPRVADQLLLAHRYYNKLTEIKKAQREAYTSARAALPDIAPHEEVVAALVVRVADLRTRIKGAKAAEQGMARAATAPLRVALASVQAELKLARERLKAARVCLATDPTLQAASAAAREIANAAVRAARAASGLYWGTYLLVEKAIEGACATPTGPQFHSWRGEGRVGVQLMKGLSVAAAFGQDTRLRIEPVPAEAYVTLPGHKQASCAQRRLMRTRVWLRAGTQEDGRTPIWAIFPIILHRPLPTNGVIMWAWIKKTRDGLQWHYDFQIAIESPNFVATPAVGNRACALDLGWRLKEEDTLRVAWLSDNQGHEEEICIPADIPRALKHADQLRATQDKNLDALKVELVPWLAKHRGILPEWLVKAAEAFAKWKSNMHVYRLVERWRTLRFPGDETIFPVLAAWRLRFRHLYPWETNERHAALGRRREFFRMTAQRLARNYAQIAMEKFDLRKAIKRAPPEGEDKLHKAARHQRVLTAPGEFRNEMKLACGKAGVTISWEPAYMTTQTCHLCGCSERWDTGPNIMHKCIKCGAKWDQDLNAGHNILASASVTSQTPELLEKLGTDGDLASTQSVEVTLRAGAGEVLAKEVASAQEKEEK